MNYNLITTYRYNNANDIELQNIADRINKNSIEDLIFREKYKLKMYLIRI